MKKRKLLILLSMVFLLSACGFGGLGQQSITIGTQTFTESKIIAYMYKNLIEQDTDIEVNVLTDLAASPILIDAMNNDDVQLGSLYTGEVFNGYFPFDQSERDPEAVLRAAQEGFDEYYNFTWLDSLGFENTYVLTVTEEVAQEYNLETVSDLAEVAAEMRLGVDTTWLERENDGYGAFTETYGFEFGEVFPMEIGLVYNAVASGEVDIVLAYSTDPRLKQFNLVTLEEDKNFFPPYDMSTVMKNELLEENPEIETILSPLIGTIDEAKMTELNYLVDIDGYTPEDVARSFLSEQGLLDEEFSLDDVFISDAGGIVGFYHYLLGNWDTLLELTYDHILMVILGITAALIVGVPLGILSAKSERLARIILTLTNLIQVFPSLALLAVLMIFFGLGFNTVVIGLFLYSLLPITRNTYVGLKNVSGDLSEAGRGVGMNKWQLLLIVQIPLSIPFLLTGIRVAAVIAIGVATIAPFIGGDGLGREVYSGINLRDNMRIYGGAIPAALLAIVADLLLGRLEKRVTPK